MADRMQVTSFIGDSERLCGPDGTTSLNAWNRCRNLCMRLTYGCGSFFPQLQSQSMSGPAPWPQVLDFFGTPFVIEASPGQLSNDAGLLPVRQFDQRIGVTRSFADALDDPRDPDCTEHTFLEMVRAPSTASSPATLTRTTTTPPR